MSFFGRRFSFYNPRMTVYNFDRMTLGILYRVYRLYGVIPSADKTDTDSRQSALIHLAVECESKGIEVESFLSLIECYRKGLDNDTARFNFTI